MTVQLAVLLFRAGLGYLPRSIPVGRISWRLVVSTAAQPPPHKVTLSVGPHSQQSLQCLGSPDQKIAKDKIQIILWYFILFKRFLDWSLMTFFEMLNVESGTGKILFFRADSDISLPSSTLFLCGNFMLHCIFHSMNPKKRCFCIMFSSGTIAEPARGNYQTPTMDQNCQKNFHRQTHRVAFDNLAWFPSHRDSRCPTSARTLAKWGSGLTNLRIVLKILTAISPALINIWGSISQLSP
jgi:hypothetical protein